MDKPLIPSNLNTLPWPQETAQETSHSPLRWQHPGSNICLDFHGDPVTARLVVFSDGNHHMALEAALKAFHKTHPDVNDIFYATTPPNVLLNYLKSGALSLGNLVLSRRPHVFISPANVLNQLQALGMITSHQAFMQSRGNVLLIRKGNPKQIYAIEDLLRDDVRLFLSNPETEKASYQVYSQSISALGKEAGLDADALNQLLIDRTRICFGDLIHHREAPQCLYDGRADVAMLYYHLALRYSRIFPEEFDFVPLGGDREHPQPSPGNLSSTYHVGVIDDGGEFGLALQHFLMSDITTELYYAHGLRRPD